MSYGIRSDLSWVDPYGSYYTESRGGGHSPTAWNEWAYGNPRAIFEGINAFNGRYGDMSIGQLADLVVPDPMGGGSPRGWGGGQQFAYGGGGDYFGSSGGWGGGNNGSQMAMAFLGAFFGSLGANS